MFKGKPRPPEVVAKMRAYMTGRPALPGAVERMAAALRGKPKSAVWKAAMSSRMLGVPRPPEVTAKMKATKKAKRLARLAAARDDYVDPEV